MLKFSPLCLAAVLLLQLPVTATQAQASASTEEIALATRIDAIVAPYYPQSGPGATLIVVKDGKTILRKAYGLADVAQGVPMQASALMRLGSITKQFTSTAVLMLADEGKLALSDPMTKFFPDYPAAGKNITIEHLLTHTSGIVSYTSKRAWRSEAARKVGVQEMINGFKDDPLEFAPGSRYAYNNSGYFLLGALIEKLSGQPYAKFVEQRIFAPLGMTHTAYEGFETAQGPRATGHSPSMWGGFKASATLHMSQPYAAGALVSTVDDMAKWDAAVGSGKLLKPASWTRAHTPYTLADGTSTHYGYGWKMARVRGAIEIGHGGDIHGFTAYSLRLPEHKVYVALLTNADTGMVRPAVLAKKAAAILIGNPYPDYRPVAQGTGVLDAYTGAYKLRDKVTRTVRRSQDHLQIVRSGRATESIYPLGGDRFFMKDALTVYRFERNAAGNVERLVLADDGVEQVHVKD